MARHEAEAEVDFHMDSEEDEEGLMNEAEDDEDEEVRPAPAYRPPAAPAPWGEQGKNSRVARNTLI
jgi:hypothetical protein